MTSHRIGVNLRVSGNCDQGARKYMEDNHVIKFLKKDTDDYEFAYFGIFDGHGGPEASAFCRDNLLNEITKYDGFWTDDDEQVLSAIRKGFLDTHNAMWNVLDTWPKTVTGLPSTAGSTATVAIIKQGKLYTGHVGDSGLVLGENDAYATDQFPVQAICVTKEHKPDDPDERLRIEDAGGEVINKSGVPRVVWSRPKTNHKGPIRRSTQIDQIPFLAVARSLGDLWSYDYYTETYVVSPDPDVAVLRLDPTKHRCLILASDGLWNMLTPEETVNMVMDLETQFEQRIINDPNVAVSFWSNPAERLVARALNKWRSKALKADNTSCVVVLVDPLGPSKLTLLKRKRQELLSGGEITPSQINKFSSLPTTSQIKTLATTKTPAETDAMGKHHNRNANCSLSDSHLRITDDSMIQGLDEQDPQGGSTVTKRSYGGQRASYNPGNESVNDSIQFIPEDKPWNLRHSLRKSESGNMSHNASSLRHETSMMKKMHPSSHPPVSRMDTSHGPERFRRGDDSVFTRLVDSKVTSGIPGDREILKDLKRGKASHKYDSSFSAHKNVMSRLIVDEHMGGFDEDVEIEKDSDSEDDEDSIPQPPPSTPCSSEEKAVGGGESDGENSLHSSADVTDLAFSLASDESLESPETSVEERPRTPLSAPAKLSSSRSRRHQISRSAKRKLVVRPGKKVNILKQAAGTKSRSTAASSPLFKVPLNPQKSTGVSSPLTRTSLSLKSSQKGTSKNASTCTSGSRITAEGSSKFQSPPKQVLNMSKSMNEVTPKNKKDAVSSVSCTGLTPDMSLLLTEKRAVGHPAGSVKDISTHYYPILTSNRLDSDCSSTLRSKDDNFMVVDDPDPTTMPSVNPSEPLKQLNKTGPIRKSGSKRWGNFLRASKLGLDNIFHHGSKKGSDNKRTSVSTGKLETELQRAAKVSSTSAKNSSMSTSRLGDLSLVHLPDVTVSHLADVTVDASTLDDGDLTTLSALSAEDSLLSAAVLGRDPAGHHSMLEEGPAGKATKHRKGFLQKTRFTLSRARKAAKKAFFPENHRLFNHKSVGKKRKSDEFLPSPSLKKRRHVEADC